MFKGAGSVLICAVVSALCADSSSHRLDATSNQDTAKARVVVQFAFSVGRASTRAGSSVASPHQIVPTTKARLAETVPGAYGRGPLGVSRGRDGGGFVVLR